MPDEVWREHHARHDRAERQAIQRDQHHLRAFVCLIKGMMIAAHTMGSHKGYMYIRGEYRYSKFDTETVAGFLDVDPTAQTLRMVLSYKFGRRDEAPVPLK